MENRGRARVLIAEDSYLISRMIAGLLEELGYTVVGTAADGLEAVEMAQTLDPDVVLMDLDMPDVGGIEATRRIYETRPTPVVILTAYETIDLVESAGRAGAGAYLSKPPDAREIERAIIIAMARFRDMMELRRLNAELQEHNEELDAFAHTVAHDLKTPLSLITGYAEFLMEGYGVMPEERAQDYLKRVLWNGYKMGNIIDELLLFASVRKDQVEVGVLDMGSIVGQARERLARMVGEYQAEITVPDEWPTAIGYAPWVEEVWVNYLSNALKYGGRPARVELGAKVLPDGKVRFWTRDNGEGLTEEERERLFMPFTRAFQARVKGFGLGLSIVRRIVDKLGGEVGVESTLGPGSVFTFTLPGQA